MSQFGPIASGLFSDGGDGIVIVSSASSPLAGQVLTATSPSTANWQDISTILSAGLGIDAAQLALDNIQLEVTARFTFSGNALELAAPVTVPLGGTGVVTLTSNGVLIGQGAAAVNTAKQAPTGDFVGTTDVQILTDKTVTDASNDITGTGIFSNTGLNTVTVSGSAAPTVGQVLRATSPTDAEWGDPSPLTAGLGIDPAQEALDVIQLEVSPRFTFSGNALELATVTVPFGGTGQTTLTSNGVLVGDGTNPVDTSKQAPSGLFVGTTDVQVLSGKTITDASNDVTATGIFSNGATNTIDVNASANPVSGQILIASSPTAASWQYKYESFYAYASTGLIVVPIGSFSVMVYDTVVINQNSSNYSYNAGTGELTINDTGLYQFNICVNAITNGTGGADIRSSMACLLQRSTGAFSSVSNSIAFVYIRRNEVGETIYFTVTSMVINEVTVSPTIYRVVFSQTADVDLLTYPDSRINVKRLN